MSRVARHIALAAVLLGQLLLAVQSFAASECHTPSDDHDMATHADHAGGSASHGDGHPGRHAAHGPDDSDAGCRCVTGMHCAQLSAVLVDHDVMLTFAGRPLPVPGPSPLDTALAHSDGLFRPPIPRV